MLFRLLPFPTPNAANTTEIVSDPSLLMPSSNAAAAAITEVVPQNAAFADSYGNCSAWAEIKNTSDMPLQLSEYYLTDDPEDAFKWRCPDAVLQPNECVVVFFSGRNETSGEFHASFRLGKEDTSLLLFSKEGQQCASITWPAGLPEDIAVLPGALYTAYPTPGTENDANVLKHGACSDGYQRRRAHQRISPAQRIQSTRYGWRPFTMGRTV